MEDIKTCGNCTFGRTRATNIFTDFCRLDGDMIDETSTCSRHTERGNNQGLLAHKVVQGDILQQTGMIVQQVNCMGVMGSGLAWQIRKKYPQVYADYQKACRTVSRSFEMLGKVSFTQVSADVIIASVFGQNLFGTQGNYTNYPALEKGLRTVVAMASLGREKICIPYKMGCGLAGGDWDRVQKIIQDTLGDTDYQIYKL